MRPCTTGLRKRVIAHAGDVCMQKNKGRLQLLYMKYNIKLNFILLKVCYDS